jgi:hypothetical protein
MHRWTPLLAVGALVACSKSGGDAGATAKPEATPAKTAEAAAAPGATGGTAAAKPTLAGHSAVPTLEEWNGVGEVTVKGSTALGCETKQLREWVRVTCRPKSKTSPKPTGVTVDRGDKNKGEVFKFVSGDVVSLVFPFVDGTDFAATFTWSDGSHQMVASWPHGSPQPAAVGEFK